ncbi:MAG: 3-oxoacid CoA-transferase subunit B [Chloroflexi bacterium]|nr:3-oxoacid CoA-transferase subunit B [Chloroflexota bacterium]MCI0778845.1 3-oxoacid CoA-transferase subunit B [Chloroflexota bacterium]
MASREPLSRQAMADRIAMEFEDGWVVNLGVGMPTLCSNFVHPEREITYQSENGLVNYGPLAVEGEEDPNLVNAGGQYVIPIPGMAVLDHADAFALIRAGYVDVTVLGAYEVAANGDLANWRLAGRKGGGIGGAMDLAVGARNVFVMMEHTTREGAPRIVERCAQPITAPGVVKLVATTLGLFEITPDGFVLREIAPGYTPDEVQAATGAKLIVPPDMREFRTRE